MAVAPGGASTCQAAHATSGVGAWRCPPAITALPCRGLAAFVAAAINGNLAAPGKKCGHHLRAPIIVGAVAATCRWHRYCSGAVSRGAAASAWRRAANVGHRAGNRYIAGRRARRQLGVASPAVYSRRRAATHRRPPCAIALDSSVHKRAQRGEISAAAIMALIGASAAIICQRRRSQHVYDLKQRERACLRAVANHQHGGRSYWRRHVEIARAERRRSGNKPIAAAS